MASVATPFYHNWQSDPAPTGTLADLGAGWASDVAGNQWHLQSGLAYEPSQTGKPAYRAPRAEWFQDGRAATFSGDGNGNAMLRYTNNAGVVSYIAVRLDPNVLHCYYVESGVSHDETNDGSLGVGHNVATPQSGFCMTVDVANNQYGTASLVTVSLFAGSSVTVANGVVSYPAASAALYTHTFVIATPATLAGTSPLLFAGAAGMGGRSYEYAFAAGEVAGGSVPVPPAKPPIKIAMAGDSHIAYATYANNTGASLAAALGQLSGVDPRNITLTNHGMPGRTSKDWQLTPALGGEDDGAFQQNWSVPGATHLQRFIEQINATNSTIVLFGVGTNDSKVGASQIPAAAYKQYMQAIAASVLANCPQVKTFVLTAPFSPVELTRISSNFGGAFDASSLALIPQYKTALQQIAAADTTGKIKMGDATMAALFLAHPEFSDDGIHMNNVGGVPLGTAWANAIFAATSVAAASTVAVQSVSITSPVPAAIAAGSTLTVTAAVYPSGASQAVNYAATLGTFAGNVYTPPATPAAGSPALFDTLKVSTPDGKFSATRTLLIPPSGVSADLLNTLSAGAAQGVLALGGSVIIKGNTPAVFGAQLATPGVALLADRDCTVMVTDTSNTTPYALPLLRGVPQPVAVTMVLGVTDPRLASASILVCHS